MIVGISKDLRSDDQKAGNRLTGYIQKIRESVRFRSGKRAVLLQDDGNSEKHRFDKATQLKDLLLLNS